MIPNNGCKERVSLQLNYLYVVVFAIFPTFLNFLEPLSFFYTNLAHTIQNLTRGILDCYVLYL